MSSTDTTARDAWHTSALAHITVALSEVDQAMADLAHGGGEIPGFLHDVRNALAQTHMELAR